MKVIIMQGASGSGKSTYVKNNHLKALLCSADHFFIDDGEYKFDPELLGAAHKTCMYKFIQACQSEEQVIVVDNTNTTRVELAPYVSVATAFGAEGEIIRCEAPADVCASRSTHGVSAKACEAMVKRIQDPMPFWDVTLTKIWTGV